MAQFTAAESCGWCGRPPNRALLWALPPASIPHTTQLSLLSFSPTPSLAACQPTIIFPCVDLMLLPVKHPRAQRIRCARKPLDHVVATRLHRRLHAALADAAPRRCIFVEFVTSYLEQSPTCLPLDSLGGQDLLSFHLLPVSQPATQLRRMPPFGPSSRSWLATWVSVWQAEEFFAAASLHAWQCSLQYLLLCF